MKERIRIIVLLAALLLPILLMATPMSLVFNTNLSSGTTIELPLFGTVNVTIDWGDGGATEAVSAAGNKEHTYSSEGTYTVSIDGSLTQFGNGFHDYVGNDKLTKVTSFGSIGLTSLSGAFHNATNLTQVPNTLPSGITNLYGTFYGASSFNQSIDSWDVSNVTDMTWLFAEATSFNQDLNSWVTSSVQGNKMSGIFDDASNFNGNITNWDVSHITTTDRMFSGASSFNQNIGNWDVSNVSSMPSMFSNATSFNQDISGWDVSNVTSFHYTFFNTLAFNQNISNWNVSNVTAMDGMFQNATAFNQNISSWNVSNVTTMNGMLLNATAFNQDISSWNVSNVTDMSYMFNNATSFDQNLGNWNVSNVTNMTHMFTGVTLSTSNYDAILNGWSALTLQNNVTFDAGNSTYSSNGATAKQNIIDTYSWTINDGGNADAMKLVFNTNLSSGTTIALPLFGTVNVTVDWGDGTTEAVSEAGNKEHTYSSEGTYTVSINGTLTQFGNGSPYTGADKITKVINFGNIGLVSLIGAFYGASNLTEVPTSIPSAVINMDYMFILATSFNQDIAGWDVSNVSYFLGMFYGATAFNQDISSWNVSNANDMNYMFYSATSFNQDISSWNVSNVTTMNGMFNSATSFNQDISSWNVSNVTNMYRMFNNATSFDQNLGNWNVSNVTNMTHMFTGITLSTSNYDAILNGWSALTLQNNVTFDAGNSKYSSNGATAKQNIIDTYSWTINDGGELLPPAKAINPSPTDATTNVYLESDLGWENDSNTNTVDLYFDTNNPPATKVIDNVLATSYDPGTLSANTTYYWKVVSKNMVGNTEGDVWSFTTGTQTSPPINIMRGGPSTSNPLAEVYAIDVHGNVTVYNSGTLDPDVDTYGGWRNWQCVFDRGTYQDSKLYWNNDMNTCMASTWSTNGGEDDYGILLIDLKQLRTVNDVYVFQQFSDGKTTQIQVFGNSDFTDSTQPAISSTGWTSLCTKTNVGAGTKNSDEGRIESPTHIDLTDMNTRYIMIYAWNDGTFGYADYIELKGVKMFASSSTLPVELSSFTAIQTSENFAQLNWVTQSETDLLGYNVYRDTTDSENSRIKINSTIIAAENSSNENVYSFNDNNTEMNQSYYYWLESVDFDGTTQFYGPVNITLGSDDPHNPDAPQVQIAPGIKNIYPNPFNPRTTINYYLKNDADVVVTIYNAKGQKVNEFNQGFQKAEKMHSLVWNGKNSNSKDVSSGIYFFKLNAGKLTAVKRAILLK
jgi:surface protein